MKKNHAFCMLVEHKHIVAFFLKVECCIYLNPPQICLIFIIIHGCLLLHIHKVFIFNVAWKKRKKENIEVWHELSMRWSKIASVWWLFTIFSLLQSYYYPLQYWTSAISNLGFQILGYNSHLSQ